MSEYESQSCTSVLPFLPIAAFLVAFFGFNLQGAYENAQTAGWALVVYLVVVALFMRAARGSVLSVYVYLLGALGVALMVLNI
jgi:hypothetical protein